MTKFIKNIEDFVNSENGSIAMAGSAAFAMDIPAIKNPYSADTASAAFWLSGWYGALGASLENPEAEL